MSNSALAACENASGSKACSRRYNAHQMRPPVKVANIRFAFGQCNSAKHSALR